MLPTLWEYVQLPVALTGHIETSDDLNICRPLHFPMCGTSTYGKKATPTAFRYHCLCLLPNCTDPSEIINLRQCDNKTAGSHAPDSLRAFARYRVFTRYFNGLLASRVLASLRGFPFSGSLCSGKIGGPYGCHCTFSSL